MSHGKNPSDLGGETISQGTVYAVVVDRNDPTKTGRIKCRILGSQDEGTISDDQLSWYPVQSQSPQMAGTGMFPASAGYLVGGRVVLNSVGQQGFIACGSVGNNEEQDQKADTHPEVKGDRPSVNNGEPQHEKVIDGNLQTNEVPSNTLDAMKRISNAGSTVNYTSTQGTIRIDENNNQAKNPKKYGGKPNKIKENEKPMPFSAGKYDNGLNAQKQVQNTPKSELIDKAVSIMENLKATAKNSLNPKMPDSVGGMGNIMSAMSSVAAFTNKHNPEKKFCDLTKEILPEDDDACILLKKLKKLAEEELHKIEEDLPPPNEFMS